MDNQINRVVTMGREAGSENGDSRVRGNDTAGVVFSCFRSPAGAAPGLGAEAVRLAPFLFPVLLYAASKMTRLRPLRLAR